MIYDKTNIAIRKTFDFDKAITDEGKEVVTTVPLTVKKGHQIGEGTYDESTSEVENKNELTTIPKYVVPLDSPVLQNDSIHRWFPELRRTALIPQSSFMVLEMDPNLNRGGERLRKCLTQMVK